MIHSRSCPVSFDSQFNARSTFGLVRESDRIQHVAQSTNIAQDNISNEDRKCFWPKGDSLVLLQKPIQTWLHMDFFFNNSSDLFPQQICPILGSCRLLVVNEFEGVSEARALRRITIEERHGGIAPSSLAKVRLCLLQQQ